MVEDKMVDWYSGRKQLELHEASFSYDDVHYKPEGVFKDMIMMDDLCKSEYIYLNRRNKAPVFLLEFGLKKDTKNKKKTGALFRTVWGQKNNQK